MRRTWVGLIGLILMGVMPVKANNKIQPKRQELPAPFNMEATIRTFPKHAELRELIRQRKWATSIALCEDYLSHALNDVQIIGGSEPVSGTEPINQSEPLDEFDEWGWRATIGELYLLNLEPKTAIRQFGYIRRLAPRNKEKSNFFLSPEAAQAFNARLRAASGLARAYAELSQWPQALNWFEQSYKEELSTQWCGTCAQGVAGRLSIVREVWKKASKPGNSAIIELQKIVQGQFKYRIAYFGTQRPAGDYEKQYAAREAALLLGEIYLRHNRQKEAQSLFLKVGRSMRQSDEVYLAATYLDRIR